MWMCICIYTYIYICIHRRYESFDPLCASTTMTPKEGSVGVAGEAVCSGGNPKRERHVELQTGRCRILVLRKF